MSWATARRVSFYSVLWLFKAKMGACGVEMENLNNYAVKATNC
jgi:hypothetical protein